LHIVHLSLTNFRNYRHLELRLPPHLVVIQGDNAQGKTNLLEAIHVLATTKSHRTSSDRELVHQAATQENLPFTRLFAEVQKARSNIKVEVILRLERGLAGETFVAPPSAMPVRKRIRVNGVARRSIDLVGQVNVVIFSAHDIDIVTGTPTLCRRYLDLVNSQTDSRYLRYLQQYHKVIVQRNHLLKLLQERQAQPEQLEFWDRELVESGSYLITQRHHLVRTLNKLSQEIHWELSSGTERLEIVYVPSVGKEELQLAEIESHFRQALDQTRRREISQGMTLVGPHRDNLQFQANEADMSRYGSRGQQRTIALSLKLAEAKYIHTKVGDSPVLLLDDMLSELDRGRRQHLLEAISSFQQVLITAVDLDYFEPSFLTQAAQFQVRQGNVRQQTS